MKKLPTYEEYLKENDSIKTTDFHRIYAMSSTWWNTWNSENKDNYEISQDAFSKTYTVSKEGKVIFIYDYSRNKIFTNERPSLFSIKNDVSPEELDKSKNIDVEDPEGILKKKKEAEDKSKEEEEKKKKELEV